MKNSLAMAILLSFIVLLSCGDDNGSTGPDDNVNFGNLTLNLQNMMPNIGEKLFLRVISENDVLQLQATIDVIESPIQIVSIPDVLDLSSDHLELYVDFNQNGVYDAPPTDQAWRVDIPSNGNVSFSHNTNFTDISIPQYSFTGGPMILNFQNFTNYIGDLMEIRVIERETGRVVGFYRFNGIPNAVFTAYLPQIIEDDRSYNIDFYVDRNQTKSYDPPPEDHAWRIETTGSNSGISINFSHNLDFTDIDF